MRAGGILQLENVIAQEDDNDQRTGLDERGDLGCSQGVLVEAVVTRGGVEYLGAPEACAAA